MRAPWKFVLLVTFSTGCGSDGGPKTPEMGDGGAGGSGGSASGSGGSSAGGAAIGGAGGASTDLLARVTELCTMAKGAHLRVKGTIDSAAFDATDDRAAGAFINGQPGQLDVLAGSPAGTSSIPVHLTFPFGIAEDTPAPIEGNVGLPASAPMGGTVLCAGAGSMALNPHNDIRHFQLAFRLVGLTRGPGCSEALEGVLFGCWSSNQ